MLNAPLLWGLPATAPTSPTASHKTLADGAADVAPELSSKIRPALAGVWPPTLLAQPNDFDQGSWESAVGSLVDADAAAFVRNSWVVVPQKLAERAQEPPTLLIRRYLDRLRASAPAPLRRGVVVVGGATPVVAADGMVPEPQDRPSLMQTHTVWRATDRDGLWALDCDVCFHRTGAMRGWCARLLVEMGRQEDGAVGFATLRATAIGVIDEQDLVLL